MTVHKGPHRSRANALKPGLTAKTMGVEGEDDEAFQAKTDERTAIFRPFNSVEREFAQPFSIAAWRRRRRLSPTARGRQSGETM